jgi:hypothetical protein
MGALEAACKEHGGDYEASFVATAITADGLSQALLDHGTSSKF